MMDAEKFQMRYNDIREICLARGGDFCAIPILDTDDMTNGTPRLIQRSCLPDNYLACPLFSFVKVLAGVK